MGTSGAYGGSGSSPWKDAHDAVANIPATSPTQQQVDKVLQSIGHALIKQNPATKGPGRNLYTPQILLGRQGGTGSVRSGGGASRGGTVSGRSTARGLAAVGAGYAYGQRDQAALDELGVGLRLADMEEMSTSQRCRYILDKVLGAPGSLEEQVLRRASLEALKVLAADKDATPDRAVEAFLAEYVYQAALVELTSAKAAKRLTPDQVLAREKSLKQWIQKKVTFSGVVDGPRFSVRALMAKADTLRDKAISLLRKQA